MSRFERFSLFHAENLRLSSFLLGLLSGSSQFSGDHLVRDLRSRFLDIIHVLFKTDDIADSLHGIIKQVYKNEIMELTKQKHDWHFGATNVYSEQLENFRRIFFTSSKMSFGKADVIMMGFWNGSKACKRPAAL